MWKHLPKYQNILKFLAPCSDKLKKSYIQIYKFLGQKEEVGNSYYSMQTRF